MAKPKVAFFDFACCEGCQLQIANLGGLLVDLLDRIQLVEFREVMSEKWEGDLDVAIIEGSITTPHAEERIKQIRDRSKILIAYGSCATIGGVNGMKNNFDPDEIRNYVYGGQVPGVEAARVKAVHQVVKVDYFVNGCPILPAELIKVLKAVLLGIPYDVPDHAVCVECKLNENVCMYERGFACLGPITRAGCDSWCINHDNICYGCRGMVSNPNTKGAEDVIAKYGIDLDLAQKKVAMYNTCRLQEQPK